MENLRREQMEKKRNVKYIAVRKHQLKCESRCNMMGAVTKEYPDGLKLQKEYDEVVAKC